MESIIHFIKHSLGLCGCCPKTLMTMLMSGTGLAGVWGFYFKSVKDKWRKNNPNIENKMDELESRIKKLEK